MSILGAQPLPSLTTGDFLPLVLLPLIFFGLRRAGVFRKGSIVGPVRVAPSESLLTLVAIVFSAYLAAMLLVVALRPVLHINEADLAAATTPPTAVPTAATEPTTAPAVALATTAPAATAQASSPATTQAATTAPTSGPTTAPASSSPQTLRLLFLVNAGFNTVAFVGILVLSFALRPGALQRLGLHPRRLPRGFLGAMLTALLTVPLVNIVTIVVVALMLLLGLKSPQPHEVLDQLTKTHDPVAVVTMIVLAVVLAPLLEELTFRGYLQTLVAHGIARLQARRAAKPQVESPDVPLASVNPDSPSSTARWIAVCITAFLFALVHREPAFMPPLFVLAAALGYVYERTGNLWICILTHALFNGFQIVAFLSLTSR